MHRRGTMKEITIYTDGACSGNPGPGGWAAVLSYKNYQKEISGNESDTTNNRMELFAAIAALEALKEPCMVDLYSDSAYLCNAILNKWIDNWQRNNWRTSAKKDVANVDLWERLIKQLNIHKVTIHKVKGHADNAFNNKCDSLARKAISDIQIQ